MPEEIFNLWLNGRIEASSWPPRIPSWAGALREKNDILGWVTVGKISSRTRL